MCVLVIRPAQMMRLYGATAMLKPRWKIFILLGDSGYPLRSYLQTPLLNPAPGTAEETFSNKLTSVRSAIERCNGVLKLRFRCLLKHRTLHYSPEKASQIINACTVLHNMCINNNLPDVLPEEDDRDLDFGIFNQLNNENEVIRARNRINPELGKVPDKT